MTEKTFKLKANYDQDTKANTKIDDPHSNTWMEIAEANASDPEWIVIHACNILMNRIANFKQEMEKKSSELHHPASPLSPLASSKDHELTAEEALELCRTVSVEMGQLLTDKISILKDKKLGICAFSVKVERTS